MASESVAEAKCGSLWTTDFVKDEAEIRRIYKQPTPIARAKEINRIDEYSSRFIALSPFVCIGTTNRDGRADVSPRGGPPGFVEVIDSRHLALPDRPGNNRLDTLINILEVPAVGMLFFVPGFDDMLRVNGNARISINRCLLERFVFEGKLPLSVLVVEVSEAQLHCTKAIRRAGLWDTASQLDRAVFPSLGRILNDQLALARDVKELDDRLDESSRNLY